MDQEQLPGAGLKQVQLAAVREIFRATAAALPLPEILPIIANVTIIAFDARSAWLMLVAGDQLQTQVARGEFADSLGLTACALGEGAAGAAALGAAPLTLQPGAIDPADPVLGPFAGQAEPVVLVPIAAAGRHLGLLGAAVPLDSFQDTSFLITLAEQAALVIESARLRREVEASAHHAEEERAMLDTLIASAPIGVAMLDPELRFLRINALLAEINGLPVEAHIGRTVRELLPAVADAAEPLLRQVLATGEPILDLELHGETPAAPGTPRIWRESFYPVRTPDGHLLGVGALVTEITEYRHLGEALRAQTAQLRLSEERFRIALSHMPVAVCSQDRALRYIWAHNTSSGHEPEALIGRCDEDLLERAEDAARLRAIKERVLASGSGERHEVPIRCGGKERVYDLIVEPLHDPDGQVEGITCAMIDITERARLLETAEAALRARDELTAMLSHDLKNPLTAVMGQAQLMRRRLKSGDADQARLLRGLGSVEEAASQMHALLDELLDMARLQAGRALHLDRQPVNLVALVKHVTQRMQAWTEHHDLRYVGDLPELTSLCDERRLERVVENLLSNAIKYSPLGGAVTVSIERQEREGRPWAAVSVTDEGIGIPSADLPLIFDRFQRGGNTVRRIPGTGLGLASARRIVEQHGGTIEVRSVEGQGSTFTICLPIEGA